MRWWLCGFIMGIFLPAAGEACDFCLVSQGVSPLETQKGTGVRIEQRYLVLTDLYLGTSKVNNREEEKETHWTTQLTAFWSPKEQFTLLAVVPLVRRIGEMTEGGERVTSRQSGLGDVALLGRYAFYQAGADTAKTTAAVLAGVKLPTGTTDGRDAHGEFVDAHLQRGTGSTDLLLGLSASHVRHRLSFSANALFSVNGEGKTGEARHRFGNTLNYDLTARWRLWPDVPSPRSLYLSLGVAGEVRGRENLELQGALTPIFGGHTVYVVPGIQYFAAPGWALELGFAKAVYHRVTGSAPKHGEEGHAHGQLGEEYRVTAAVTWRF
jgi:hypothetical protein